MGVWSDKDRDRSTMTGVTSALALGVGMEGVNLQGGKSAGAGDEGTKAKAHWKGASSTSTAHLRAYANIPDYESAPVAVSCIDVSHAFSGRVDSGHTDRLALDNFNMDFYVGHVTTVVGYAKSGKSTLINVLTDAISPSRGDVLIYGRSLKSDGAEDQRRLFGVCPQYNALFPSLTAREHLVLHLLLQGVSPSRADVQADQILEEVCLGPEAHISCSVIPYDKKRALCIAIAMLDSNKIVLLDECTHGMTMNYRAVIHKYIRSLRHDRCIIACTSSIDEAVLLGDRICVMVGGNVQACGDAEFLKEVYGVGYTLKVYKAYASQDGSLSRAAIKTGALQEGDYYMDIKQMDALVKRYVRGAVVRADRVDHRVYSLPSCNAQDYTKLCSVLDSICVAGRDLRTGDDVADEDKQWSASSLGLRSFALHTLSLEDVYRRVARNEERMENEGLALNLGQRRLEGEEVDPGKGPNPYDRIRFTVSAEPLAARERAATLAAEQKRARMMTSGRGGFEVGGGFGSGAFKEAKTRMSKLIRGDGEGGIEMEALGKSASVMENNIPGVSGGPGGLSAFDSLTYTQWDDPFLMSENLTKSLKGGLHVADSLGPPAHLVLQHVKTLCGIKSKSLFQARVPRVLWWRYAYPLISLMIGLSLVVMMNVEGVPRDVLLKTSSLHEGKITTYVAPDSASIFASIRESESRLAAFGYNITVQNNTIPTLWQRRRLASQWLFDRAFRKARDARTSLPDFRYGAFLLNIDHEGNKPDMRIYNDLTVIVNSTSVHAAPIFLNMFNSAAGRSVLNQPEFDIKTRTHPFPMTFNQRFLTDVAGALVLGLAFAFIPASVAHDMVHEQSVGVKHQLYGSGVNRLVYWISHAFMDLAAWMVPVMCALPILVAFQVNGLLGANLGACFILMVLHGFAAIPFAYVIALLSDNPVHALHGMLLFGVVTGPVCNILALVLEQLSATVNLLRISRIAFRAFPSFSFVEANANLMLRLDPAIFGSAQSTFSLDVVGYPMLYMLSVSVFFITLAWCIDAGRQKPELMQRLFPARVAPMRVEEDEDVIAERRYVLENKRFYEDDDGGSNAVANGPELFLRVLNVRKVFLDSNPSQAVHAVTALHSVSFGVGAGECIGLVGVQGAGKTTLMRILAAQLLPTSGEVSVSGLNAHENAQYITHFYGYCPQSDEFLHEGLTAREVLVLYCRIKGVPDEGLAGYVLALLDTFSCTTYADAICSHLPLDVRRRVSVAISLIGNPPMLLLDEPSRGMNPDSRRLLWQVLRGALKGRSVVLATNSMQECVALSDRVGIMLKGRLRCLGSPLHLQRRFGHGYRLSLTTAETAPDKESLKKWILRHFPGSRVIAEVNNHIIFRIVPDGYHMFSRHAEAGDRGVGVEPQGSGGAPRIFRLIEKQKRPLGIKNYCVAQVTLEQIFNHYGVPRLFPANLQVQLVQYLLEIRSNRSRLFSGATGGRRSDTAYDEVALAQPHSRSGYRASVSEASKLRASIDEATTSFKSKDLIAQKTAIRMSSTKEAQVSAETILGPMVAKSIAEAKGYGANKHRRHKRSQSSRGEMNADVIRHRTTPSAEFHDADALHLHDDDDEVDQDSDSFDEGDHV